MHRLYKVGRSRGINCRPTGKPISMQRHLWRKALRRMQRKPSLMLTVRSRATWKISRLNWTRAARAASCLSAQVILPWRRDGARRPPLFRLQTRLLMRYAQQKRVVLWQSQLRMNGRPPGLSVKMRSPVVKPAARFLAKGALVVKARRPTPAEDHPQPEVRASARVRPVRATANRSQVEKVLKRPKQSQTALR